MNIEKVINTAVGCVMASRLEMKEKREVIEGLREIEEKLLCDQCDNYEEDED